MRRELSVLNRTAAIALAGALAACASSGATVPSPQFLAAQTSPDALKNTSAPVSATKDVANLPDEPKEVSDPFERTNRTVFEGNQRFNHGIVYPVARAYRETVPEPVRDSIEAFVGNLTEPMVFANDVLQLRLGATATTFGRFAMNSTLGIGGLFDVATKENLPRQTGDFGQTLYIWGMRDSDYLVVPIIGPTNVRDLIGTTVEFGATIPVGGVLPSWLPTQVATTADNLTVAGSIASPFTKLGQVEQMEALEDSSLDFYTMLRSVVAQKRQAELQEALETSGWIVSRNFETTASASPSPFPKPVSLSAKEEELLANTLTSVH
jgi:phospholipid-binding lipoprotein MlaA